MIGPGAPAREAVFAFLAVLMGPAFRMDGAGRFDDTLLNRGGVSVAAGEWRQLNKLSPRPDECGGRPSHATRVNIVMRIVSSLIGVIMVLMGGVWVLQGLDLAFRVGFMVGDPHWTAYGAGLAAAGRARWRGAICGRGESGAAGSGAR